MALTRELLAREIGARMKSERIKLVQQWQASTPIDHFILDDGFNPNEKCRPGLLSG